MAVGPVALRQLGAVRAHYHRQVGEFRRLESQGVIELQVPGRAGQPLLGAHHVADAHQVVVGHHGQVVGGESVGLQDDEVLQQLVPPLHDAPHQVIDGRDAFGGHGEANNPRFGRRGLSRHPFVGAYIAAIAEVSTGVGPFPACLFQLLPAAVAMVGVALFHQPPGQTVVDLQSLRLEVRAVGAVHLWTFVPIDVQPA